MARLEQAVENIVDVFMAYANEDGKLTQEELKKLFEKEIACPEAKAHFEGADFNKIMGLIDKNRNGEIEFKEFVKCAGFMAKCYYHKKTGKGQLDEN
ncbi:protein S100-A1-like [Plectropomus leopardus]|uniref:protein S100-A1-like n=1 Tax=Plectropomus leopardus TaxID=160734 RepID=UPI001C4DB978|nr:protein S100-A1-like [Plectropomus leopardus]